MHVFRLNNVTMSVLTAEMEEVMFNQKKMTAIKKKIEFVHTKLLVNFFEEKKKKKKERKRTELMRRRKFVSYLMPEPKFWEFSFSCLFIHKSSL